MEKYLYFSSVSSVGSGPNADAALYPASNMIIMNPASATTTEVKFNSRSGVAAVVDTVTLTHAKNDHKNVMKAFASMANTERTNAPFVVVADKENSIFNIDGVTACAIVSAD